MPGAFPQGGGLAGARSPAKSAGKNIALVCGAGALSVVAVAGVILAPKLFGGSSDPGCKAYANTALTAYNKTINDLNKQASAATLDADMTNAITQLSAAAAKTQTSTTASALHMLLTELKTVRADVTQGSVPANTVKILNDDAHAADSACG